MSSRKDFKNKIHICKKEIQETKHWLRMISTAVPNKKTRSKKIMARISRINFNIWKNYFNIKKLIIQSKFKILNSKFYYVIK